MNCPKCQGLTILEDVHLGGCIQVVMERCLLCGLRTEQGLNPEATRKVRANQGRYGRAANEKGFA